MKQLLLIRHGKSDWDIHGLSDHDRPLNDRGRGDAPRIAAALMERGIRPGAIVTSTATRAATTASLLAAAMGFPEESIQRDPDLYLAPARTILGVVQQLDESVDTVFLFGHNPGMHEAADLLSGDTGVAEFPTLAVARFELRVDFWGEAEFGSGVLRELLMPRSLPRE